MELIDKSSFNSSIILRLRKYATVFDKKIKKSLKFPQKNVRLGEFYAFWIQFCVKFNIFPSMDDI